MKTICWKKWAKVTLVVGALPMLTFRAISEANRSLAVTEPAGRSQSKGRRAFACISGQLSRLEMESKFEHLFLPLQELGFQVDVAFALSSGRLVFSNPRKVKKQTEDMAPAFDNETTLLSYMKAHNLGVVSKKRFVYKRVSAPYANIQYEQQLMQKSQNATQERIQDRRAFRTANHARMYDSYQRCMRDIDQKTLEGYDLVVRIREDVGFPVPVQSRLFTDLPSNTIVSGDCRVWGGMNDRFAIATPDAGAKLFTLPNQAFTGQSEFPTSIKNSEQFLKFVYSNASINMATSSDFRDVAKSYVDSNGKTRFWKEDLKTGCDSSANII